MADRSQHNLAGWLGVGLAFGDTPGFDYRYHLGRLGHCDLSCVAWSVGGGGWRVWFVTFHQIFFVPGTWMFSTQIP